MAELPARMMSLRPATREALLFMTLQQALRITRDGVAEGERPLHLRRALSLTTPETDSIRRSAGLVGRWFASQGTPAFILQAMGVRP